MRIKVLLSVFIAMMVLFCGCSEVELDYSAFEKGGVVESVTRFKKVESWMDDGTSFTVYYDPETRVMYIYTLFVGYNRAGSALTVMVDADGKPLLYTPED